MRLTRRSLLLGGGAGVGVVAGGGALVEYDVLPGRTRAHEFLGLNGPAGEIPDVEPGRNVRGTLASSELEEDPKWVVCYPPGAAADAALPVVVTLHGADLSAFAQAKLLGVDRFLAASGHQFAIALVDGKTEYWHERSDGEDRGRMVVEEFLPMLGDRGLDVGRPGWLGWSMGGLGALMLSARRTAAGEDNGPVLAVSPAISAAYDEAAIGAFDSQDDWDQCMALLDVEARQPIRVDCGKGDPFYLNVKNFAEDHDVESHFEAGAHKPAYWTRELPDQLDWLAEKMGL